MLPDTDWNRPTEPYTGNFQAFFTAVHFKNRILPSDATNTKSLIRKKKKKKLAVQLFIKFQIFVFDVCKLLILRRFTSNIILILTILLGSSRYSDRFSFQISDLTFAASEFMILFLRCIFISKTLFACSFTLILILTILLIRANDHAFSMLALCLVPRSILSVSTKEE